MTLFVVIPNIFSINVTFSWAWHLLPKFRRDKIGVKGGRWVLSANFTPRWFGLGIRYFFFIRCIRYCSLATNLFTSVHSYQTGCGISEEWKIDNGESLCWCLVENTLELHWNFFISDHWPWRQVSNSSVAQVTDSQFSGNATQTLAQILDKGQ